MVHVARIGLRKLAQLAEPELGVTGDRLAAQPIPLVDMLEKESQERRLQLVETRVVADEVEARLVVRPVERKQPDALGKLLGRS